MKLVEPDPKLVRWDKFREFHVGVTKHGQQATGDYATSPFIQFATGELGWSYGIPNPDQRGSYAELGVEVWSTKDKACPALTTPDGQPVAKAWLDVSGQQVLLCDKATGRAVCTHGDKPAYPIDDVPERLVRTYKESRTPLFPAYFAGPGKPPVGYPVKVRVPDKFWASKEEREHMARLRSAAKMWTEMSDKVTLSTYGPIRVEGGIPIYLNDKGIAADKCLGLLTDPTDTEKVKLAVGGWQRKVLTYPYLLLAVTK